ncbi:hypothetical protein AN479_00025 [Serratia marcescens]|nr:hypothetical protein AN479_00025 [Serratia marcescens]
MLLIFTFLLFLSRKPINIFEGTIVNGYFFTIDDFCSTGFHDVNSLDINIKAIYYFDITTIYNGNIF